MRSKIDIINISSVVSRDFADILLGPDDSMVTNVFQCPKHVHGMREFQKTVSDFGILNRYCCRMLLDRDD